MAVPRLHTEFSQQNRLLRLHTPLGEELLLAEYLSGWEALDSGGFSLQLSALASDPVALDHLCGSPVLLELLCDDSRTKLRPFHGHVRHATRVGSNGGLTRYRLEIEPWLMFLGDRQDSFVFHDKSVIEICEQIFRYYRSSSVQSDWRWEVDSSRYPSRSLTTQFQESDLGFVQRLLAEEGIAYRFEHLGDLDSVLLGCHTLVLSDSNARLQSGEAMAVPFQRSDATESKDSVQRWTTNTRWVNDQCVRESWDHRTLSTRPTQNYVETPSIPGCVDRDISAPYGWVDEAHGDRHLRQHLEATAVSGQQVEGHGSVRRLAAGSTVNLSGHAAQSDRDGWICLRVEHEARNNIHEYLLSRIEHCLSLPYAVDDSWKGFSNRESETDDMFYRNRFSLMPATKTYRPQHGAGHGRRMNPQAITRGAQTAIVVGNGQPLLTDRDHRVKVQLHWQRGSRGAAHADHPQGFDNAPATGQSGTWVRVATGLAGKNWGSVFLPRVGQEVWVDFIEGAADRPVVVKALYNGNGHVDGPHSRIGGGPSLSTANAASWFPGNGHDDVLHGFKTQDLSHSQNGRGGYRQLQLNHTNQQSHAQLFTTDQRSGMTLGHIKQTDDNKQLKDRGHGTDLSSQGHGAVRAGDGLLLSSVAARQQMEVGSVLSDLDKAQTLVDSLGNVARQNSAGLPGEHTPLRASGSIEHSHKILSATTHGQRTGQGIGGGEGQVSAWSEPMLVVHGSAGLNSFTPKSQVWVAGTHSVFTAKADLNLTALGKTQFVAGTGLSLYTQGTAAEQRPVSQTGIALHAATGRVSLQAQADEARFAAKRNILLASTESSALVQGRTHLLLTAQGAAVKLGGGKIELMTSGSIVLKAQLHLWNGPAGGGVDGVSVRSRLNACPAKLALPGADGASVI